MWCRVRQRLFALTPEEQVRQAILWFLSEGSIHARTWAGQFRLGVERRSMDLAAYYAEQDDDRRFSPEVPVFIAETKQIRRACTNDSSTTDQLKTYLCRERCRDGFVFNGREAAWMVASGPLGNATWNMECLADLNGLETRIQTAVARVSAEFLGDKATFLRAEDGDFDAFRLLVDRFGSDPATTFVLSRQDSGSPVRVQAHSIRHANSNQVTYRSRRIASRHRQQLCRQEFRSLLSVVPLDQS